MSLLSQIRWRLFGVRDPVVDRTELALQVANESRAVTQKLNDTLKSYQREDRPFVALLIDLENERQRKAQLAQWNDA